MSENKFVFSSKKEKDWLKGILRSGNVTVEFVKKDGSARTMVCTLNEEAIPSELAKQITESVSIPTVGIGAGVNCDAQILVWTDLVGLTANPPKLAKAYRNLRQEITGAAEEFARDVRGGTFPGPENTFN